MRYEVATNFDTNVFYDILESGDIVKRLKLASQLSDFIISDHISQDELEAVVPIMLKLCVDPIREVREIVAEKLVGDGNLNADIVFSIIADEDAIALPFLSETPALNHWHMLAVLRVGDMARQMCVAKRRDLSTEAVGYILRSAPLEVCRATLNNVHAHIDEHGYRAIYERFGQLPEVVEILLSKPDLPLDIRIGQTKRASHRMRQLMAERGWVAVTEAAHLVEDAEDNAVLSILSKAGDEALGKAISFLITKKMLTSSLIVRAAATGDMRIVHWALAYLGGVSVERSHEMLFGKGRIGLKALHNRAGLPPSCMGLLQAACDVARDVREEGVPLAPSDFGRRLIEALMTRYENMAEAERTKNLELVARFGDDKVRKIAKRLRADMVRAA